MSDKEQTEIFAVAIQETINRFIAEFDISFATAIGVLELAKARCIRQALNEGEEED